MSVEALSLHGARSDKAAGFERLFVDHYRAVWHVLYRLVGDEADDLAQEVFLQLHDRPPGLEGEELSAWLYRVATNRGLNALRSHQRRGKYRDRLAVLTSGMGWRQPEAAPEAATELEERQAQVRRVLAQLTQRQASLLVLRYSGLSYREVARALQVAPGSVGTLLARAEKVFRDRWIALYGDGEERGTGEGTEDEVRQ